MTHPIVSLSRIAAFAVAATAAAAASAATVNVSYTDPDHFTDAATTRFETAANLKALTGFLQQTGRQLLPADQTLTIEVLDIDLAGIVKPQPTRDLRVLNGGADWPVIRLRYRLESGGQTLASGEERIADMQYLSDLKARAETDPLRYEKAMLRDWMKTRLVERSPAPQ